MFFLLYRLNYQEIAEKSWKSAKNFDFFYETYLQKLQLIEISQFG